MSKKYGICCANCNVALNNEDDIFGTNCGHLYHFHCIINDHGKSEECVHCEAYKPMLYKMHLQFDDAPLSEEVKEKNIELCSKLNELERINAFLQSSHNSARQFVQELESKIKTLKDGLQAKEEIAKELQDRVETLELLNEYLTKNANNAPNTSNTFQNKTECKNINENNKKPQPNKNNKSKKQSYKAKGLNNNNNNKNQDDAKEEESASNSNNNEKKTCEKNESDDDSEDTACAIKEQSTLNGKREIFNTKQAGNTVMIKNFKSSDVSTEFAITNIVLLAEQMGLSLTPDQIKNVHVFRENENFLSYIVEFYTKNMADAFLGKKHILKKFPHTKFLFIL